MTLQKLHGAKREEDTEYKAGAANKNKGRRM
jgi:hypothetical protein